MTVPRTLIAGFGNLLLGDDGFGVEVVRRLSRKGLPSHVRLLDVGIGGMDFVLEAMTGFDRIVIIDAVRRGSSPGTLHVFTPGETDLPLRNEEPVNPHITEPTRALSLARSLGALLGHVTVVGCEPEVCDLQWALSPRVRDAVDRAVERILILVEEDGHAGRAAG